VSDRPIPNVNDHDTGGYFAAAARGEVAVRACTDCGTVLQLPRAYCSACGSWSTEWKAVAPTATLYSYTVTERELRPGFPPPYTVVTVELDEAPGTRFVGYLPGRHELQIGMPMRATFEELEAGVTLTQWV
jgi:uncharacterized OB-fold protein